MDVPSEQCDFAMHPTLTYMWDPTCKEPGSAHAGCKADGIHEECSFCGEAPYPPCPTCEFSAEPAVRVIWDNRCASDGYSLGCNADGVHFECRYCGEGAFDPCTANAWPPSVNSSAQCSFASAPSTQ